MTQEEKLEEAKRLYETANADQRYVLESLFPELKESEDKDEKVRKALIKLVTNHASMDLFIEYDIHLDEALSYLEKQGENTHNKELSELLHKVICRFINDPNIPYTEREKVSMEIIPYVERLEKQGEQKPADKVEPKFKVGEWIVYREDIWKIGNIALENYYELLKTNNEVATRAIKEVDENAHLWTIQDAKDGDVLVSESTCGLGTWYCIFKSLDGDESMTVHCYLARDGRFETKKELCFDKDPYNTNPATKEQRDLLFQKMKEAGYEWDTEKKELKKIEQKPSWSEEDEDIINKILCICDDFEKSFKISPASTKVIKEDVNKIDNWLKSLKERIKGK